MDDLTSTSPVQLVHPDGELYEVGPNSVKESLEAGYRYPTANELSELHNEEQYGAGFGNSAVAGVLGAARGASIETSDLALTKSGVISPDVIKQLQERHPIASTVGEVIGVLADPLGLVGEVGTGAKAVAKGLLGSAPEEIGLAHQVLRNTASKGIGSAVEGAAFGTGNVISEEALGDPNVTAENIISQIGHSALLGASIGGALGFAETAIPPSIQAAKKALAGTSDTLGVGTAADAVKDVASKGYAKASSIVSGASPDEILAAIKNRGEEVPLKAEEVASSMQKQYEAVEKAKSTAFEDIRPQESEKFVAGVRPEVAQAEYERVINEVDRVTEEIRSKPDIYPQRYAAKLEQFTDRLNQSIEEGAQPYKLFSSLDDLKGQIDKDIKYGKFPSAADQDAQELIGGLRRTVKESLENPDIWGQAGSRQAAFNDAASSYLSDIKDFQKRFMYKVTGKGGSVTYKIDPIKVQGLLKNADSPQAILKANALSKFNNSSSNLLDQIEQTYKNLPEESFNRQTVQDLVTKNEQALAQAEQQGRLNNLSAQLAQHGEQGILGGGLVAAGAKAAGASYPLIGSLVAGYETLRNPGLTIQRLARLEELAGKAMKQISGLTKAIVRPASKAAGELAGYTGAKLSIPNKGAYDRITSQVQQLAGNPEQLLDQMQGNLQSVTPHAPKIAQAMQESNTRAVAFLASKVATNPNEGPLAPKFEPSGAQIAEFGAYYKAVEDPMSVLKDAANGQLTHYGVEAFGTVYPQLFKQAQTALLSHLSEIKREVPYKNRMMLTMLLGKDMDGSLSPASITQNQQALGIAQMQQQQKDQAFMGMPKARAKGLDNLKAGQRSMLPMQISANRGSK